MWLVVNNWEYPCIQDADQIGILLNEFNDLFINLLICFDDKSNIISLLTYRIDKALCDFYGWCKLVDKQILLCFEKVEFKNKNRNNLFNIRDLTDVLFLNIGV